MFMKAPIYNLLIGKIPASRSLEEPQKKDPNETSEDTTRAQAKKSMQEINPLQVPK